MPSGLVTLGRSTAVVSYERALGDYTFAREIFVKKSTDAGRTWGSRVKLSSAGCCSSIVGRGSSVDIVWAEGDFENGFLTFFYRRSADRGLTFGPAITIVDPPADPLSYLQGLHVARGPNGVVAVVWEEYKVWIDNDYDVEQVTIRARVSTDGGASFGKPRTVATVPGEGGSSIAIGDGVIYVAYIKDYGPVRLKRSIDAGKSWSHAVTISASSEGALALTAAGSDAYVAYSRYETRRISLRYRRTTNKGATWSASLVLSSRAKTVSGSPVLSLKGGVLRAAYELCGWNCTVPGDLKSFYRESANGTTWTPPELVAEQLYWPPAGIGYAGRPIVLLRQWREFVDGDGNYVYETRPVVRRR